MVKKERPEEYEYYDEEEEEETYPSTKQKTAITLTGPTSPKEPHKQV